MKIISILPGDRIMINVTKKEFANLLGHYSNYDVKEKDINEHIEKGSEIPIHEIYEKHRLINEIQKSNDYDKARRKLERMLEALTPIEEKIKLISDEKS